VISVLRRPRSPCARFSADHLDAAFGDHREPLIRVTVTYFVAGRANGPTAAAYLLKKKKKPHVASYARGISSDDP